MGDGVGEILVCCTRGDAVLTEVLHPAHPERLKGAPKLIVDVKRLYRLSLWPVDSLGLQSRCWPSHLRQVADVKSIRKLVNNTGVVEMPWVPFSHLS